MPHNVLTVYTATIKTTNKIFICVITFSLFQCSIHLMIIFTNPCSNISWNGYKNKYTSFDIVYYISVINK